MTVFLVGVLLSLLILVVHLPRWLETGLGFIVTTITIGTMWAVRAKSQTPSIEAAAEMSAETLSNKSDDRTE